MPPSIMYSAVCLSSVCTALPYYMPTVTNVHAVERRFPSGLQSLYFSHQMFPEHDCQVRPFLMYLLDLTL